MESILVTIRATIMLVCLVAVPLYAVFGTALPAKIVALWGGREQALTPTSEATSRTALPEAPPFRAKADAAPATIESAAEIRLPQSIPVHSTQVQATSASPNRAVSHQVVEPKRDGQSAPPLSATARSQASAEVGPSALPPRDQFVGVERRLKELGATYYRLETWGDAGELYRFHCQMTLAGNSSATRHFEATDRDALQAMGRVLGEVEGWRAGHLR